MSEKIFYCASGKNVSPMYFENRSDALRYAERCVNEFEHTCSVKRIKLHFHHRASSRGYLCKNGGYISSYSGLYGDGIIIHIPNINGSPNNSNKFHYIDYYIK